MYPWATQTGGPLELGDEQLEDPQRLLDTPAARIQRASETIVWCRSPARRRVAQGNRGVRERPDKNVAGSQRRLQRLPATAAVIEHLGPGLQEQLAELREHRRVGLALKARDQLLAGGDRLVASASAFPTSARATRPTAAGSDDPRSRTNNASPSATRASRSSASHPDKQHLQQSLSAPPRASPDYSLDATHSAHARGLGALVPLPFDDPCSAETPGTGERASNWLDLMLVALGVKIET
jgi:hypothetical protein